MRAEKGHGRSKSPSKSSPSHPGPRFPHLSTRALNQDFYWELSGVVFFLLQPAIYQNKQTSGPCMTDCPKQESF